MSIATWGLMIDFLGGASEARPPSDPENLYPLRGRVKLDRKFTGDQLHDYKLNIQNDQRSLKMGYLYFIRHS